MEGGDPDDVVHGVAATPGDAVVVADRDEDDLAIEVSRGKGFLHLVLAMPPVSVAMSTGKVSTG